MNGEEFTGIIRENTTRMLKEAEQQTPIQAQIYSDMYREYTHMLENFFEVMRHSEKGMTSTMGIESDPIVQSALGDAAGMVADNWFAYLGNCVSIQQWYAKTRAQMTKSYGKYAKSMINVYIQSIEQYSAPKSKTWQYGWWNWQQHRDDHNNIEQDAQGA